MTGEIYKGVDIDKLAQRALDAACLCIQEYLGVDSGDVAAQVFSGDEAVTPALKSYIRTELNFMEDDERPPYEPPEPGSYGNPISSYGASI